jgi:hypothetical protein
MRRAGETRKEHTVNTIRTRLARLTAASVVVLGLGAMGASPALASYSSWAGSVPDTAPEVVWSGGNDASPNTGSTWSG